MTPIRPKRILFITPFAAPNIGGVETHIELLRNYLRTHGYHVTVLTYQPLTTTVTAPTRATSAETDTYRFRWLGRNLFSRLEKHSPLFNFLYLTPYLLLRSIGFMLRHHAEVDVIHVFGLNAGMIGRALKVLFRKRVIMSTKGIHGFTRATLIGRVMRSVVLGVDKVLVGSLDSKDDFLNLGIPASALQLYTHWINQDRFHPAPTKEESRPSHSFTVVYMGRLIPPKGIDILIALAASMPQVMFMIIGDGILQSYVAAAARACSNIRYIGPIDQATLAMHVQSADVFVYPVTYHEDVSLAILEALACGIPVISSTRGSGSYRLTEEFALFTPPTVEEIKKQIVWLQTHPKQLAAMSQHAVRFGSQFNSELATTITHAYEVS